MQKMALAHLLAPINIEGSYSTEPAHIEESASSESFCVLAEIFASIANKNAEPDQK